MADWQEPDRETLMEIIENSLDSIFVTDGKGKVILVNPVATDLMNTTKDQLLGRYIQDLVKEGYYKNSSVLKTLKSHKPETAMIYYTNNLSGISSTVPVWDAKGELKMTITNTSGERRIKLLQSIIDQEHSALVQFRREVEHLRNSKQSGEIVCESRAMKAVLQTALSVAPLNMPVLLIGETGVGKNVVANYIHRSGPRSDHAFVDINCAAIPEALLEAELFGYEQGAFTGAGRNGKIGLLEVANQGVLFLDEVGELTLPLQAKLLKVLETGTFRRVGGTANLHTDTRIVCATNRDLDKMVENKTFRADLFYRLDVLRIDIPPLRERTEDIIPLAEQFLKQQNEKYNTDKTLTEEFCRELLAYSWPGNVRELHNVISRAYYLSGNGALQLDSLGDHRGAEKPETPAFPADEKSYGTLRDFRRKAELWYIDAVLKRHKGNVRAAAEELGMSRSQVYRILSQAGDGEEEEQ